MTTETLDPVKIGEQLERISASVKEEGTRLMKETEKHGAANLETKKLVDDLLLKQGTMAKTLIDLEQKLEAKKQGDSDDESLHGVLAKHWPGVAKDFLENRSFSKSNRIDISRKALTNTGTTGAALNYPGMMAMPTPLSPLMRRLTVRDLLAQGRISKSVLFYMRESGYTNNAAPVSEGSLKPKSELTFELITEPVRTIAHLFDISLQMLDDVDFIESYIETRGRYGLKLVEEAQLLTGSGTGQNLEGIYTAATAYSQPSGVTINAATETDIDKLRLALLQVELANAFATGIVLHPTDWASIELIKTTENAYLFVNPQNATTPRLWGRDVVSTQAMTQTKFLVGDFMAHAQIFDRQDANVAISFENKDNFERNMATIRIEERLALAIYRPEAFVKGTLESAS
jgi:HK97 family phage major capsid protein